MTKKISSILRITHRNTNYSVELLCDNNHHMFGNTKTLVQKDIEISQQKYSLFQLLRFSKIKLGLDPSRVIIDWLSLRLSDRKLSLREYLLYGLYKTNLTKNEKKRFVGENNQYWVLIFEIARVDQILISNKTLIYEILEDKNIPIPITHGIIYKKPPKRISGRLIKNPQEFYDFLEEHKGSKLFGKPNFGVQSLGVFIITSHTHEHIALEGKPPVSYKKIFKEIIGKNIFLIQEFVENHKELQKFTPYTCTVRIYNIIRGQDIHSPFMLIKIPVKNNIADNFWRKGNIVASINIKTGVIERAVQQDGPILNKIHKHPDTGEAFLGFKIPFWDEVLEINKKAAYVCRELRYQALDIAITDNGPVVIEVNHNGSFILPQSASGKGFLTNELLEFINWKIK